MMKLHADEKIIQGVMNKGIRLPMMIVIQILTRKNSYWDEKNTSQITLPHVGLNKFFGTKIEIRLQP